MAKADALVCCATSLSVQSNAASAIEMCPNTATYLQEVTTKRWPRQTHVVRQHNTVCPPKIKITHTHIHTYIHTHLLPHIHTYIHTQVVRYLGELCKFRLYPAGALMGCLKVGETVCVGLSRITNTYTCTYTCMFIFTVYLGYV